MALPQDETTTEQPSIDYEALGLEPVEDEDVFGGGVDTEIAEAAKPVSGEIDYEGLGLEPIEEEGVFGAMQEEPIPVTGEEGFLRQAADVPLKIGESINSSIKGITDLFGADNAISQNLSQNADWYRSLLSAQALEDEQEVGRILQEAENEGILDQLGAGLEAFSVAPVDFVASGIGSLATFAATGVAGRAAALAGAARAGLTGAKAAQFVQRGVQATQLATGAAMGAGIVKGEIYQSVKDEMLAQGKTEEESKRIATEAQSYMGKNLDQILLGAGLGTIDAFTGAEKIIGKVLTKGGLKPDASRIGNIIKNGITEAAPEFVQAAQEKFASNLALQREGVNVPLTQGVFSQGALEGLVGLGLGVGAGAIEPRIQTPPTKEEVSAAAAETQDVARQNKDIVPATASLVEGEAEQIIQSQAETPDERVARLQREAQEAAGIELEEEVPVSGLPPVEPTPPVTPTPEAAVAPVEPVVAAEGARPPVTPEVVPEEQKFNNLRESIGATNRLVGDVFGDKIVYSTVTEEGRPEAELVIQENAEIPNRVILETIFTPPELRGRGLANEKMQSFLQNVDRLGMDVQLSVDPEAASKGVEGESMTRDQLKDWYRKYGFFFAEDSDLGIRASEATKEQIRAETKTYDPAVHKIPNEDNFFSDSETLFNVLDQNPERFKEGEVYAVDGDSVYVFENGDLTEIRDVVFEYNYDTEKYDVKPLANIISPEAKFETAVPEAAPAAVEPTPVAPPVTPQLEPLRRVARAEQTEEDVAGLVDAGFVEVYKGQPVLTQAGLDALPEAERPRLTPEARKIQIDTRTSEAAAEAISKNLRIGVDQVPVDVRMPAGWTLEGDIYVPPAVEATPVPPTIAPRPVVDAETLNPRGKQANRILTNAGVDPETAAFVAQQYQDEAGNMGAEEWRAFVLDKFEENGGVIPAQMRYSEDQEYYEMAFGIGPEEAATLVENAKAQNAQMAQAELEQNKQWRRKDEQVTEAEQRIAGAQPEAQAVPVPAGEVPPSPAIEGRRVPTAAQARVAQPTLPSTPRFAPLPQSRASAILQQAREERRNAPRNRRSSLEPKETIGKTARQALREAARMNLTPIIEFDKNDFRMQDVAAVLAEANLPDLDTEKIVSLSSLGRRGRAVRTYGRKIGVPSTRPTTMATLVHEVGHTLTATQIREYSKRISGKSGKAYIDGLRKAINDKATPEPIARIFSLYISILDQLGIMDQYGGSRGLAGTRHPDMSVNRARKLQEGGQLRNDLNSSVLYGLANVDEFVAQTFSSNSMRDLLKTIKAPESNRSIWNEFVSAIKSILNLPDDTMAAAVIQAAFDISEQVPTGRARATPAPAPPETQQEYTPRTDEEEKSFNKALSNKVLARNPELAVAAVRLKNGEITAGEYADLVDAIDPFVAKGADPIPTQEKIKQYIAADKAPMVGAKIENGKEVEFRIDIPTYNRSTASGDPVYAITAHEPVAEDAKRVGAPISYMGVAKVVNPTFMTRAISGKGTAIEIAMGAGKFPLATVKGNYEAITDLPEDINNPEVWTEVGYNPIRSSFFVDTRSGDAVISGSEAIMVGSRVFVKNAEMEPRPRDITMGGRYAPEPEGGFPTFTEGTPEAATLKAMEASMAKVDAASEAKGGKPETQKISDIAANWMDQGGDESALQDAIVENTNLTPANAARVAMAIARQYDIQQSIATAFLETQTGLSVEALPEGVTLPKEVDPDRPKPVMQRLFDVFMGVRVPPVKIEVNERTALKQQIRLKAAANRAAKAEQKRTAEEVVEIIKAMELLGPVRPKQVQALAKRAARVIWTSEKSVEAFSEYAAKVVENANYDADLRAAKDAQKRAKQLSTQKKVAMSPQRQILEDVGKVPVNKLDDPRMFAEAVNYYLRGFKDALSPDYVVIPDAEMESYLSRAQSETQRNQRDLDREANKRLAEKYGIDPDLVNEMMESFDILRQIEAQENREALENLLTEKAIETQQGLKGYDTGNLQADQRPIVAAMLKIDPKALDPEERQRFIRITNNIIYNNQTNGAEYFMAVAKGQQSAREAAQDSEMIAKNRAWINLLPRFISERMQRGWALELQSVADTFRNAFGKGAMAKVYDAIGMLDLNLGFTKANNVIDEIQEKIAEFHRNLEKKYKAAARNQDGLLAEGVVGFLIQSVPKKDEVSSISQRRDLIRQDIANRKGATGEPDRVAMADRIEAILNRIDGESVEAILNNMKREFPANHESLVWYKDTLLPQYKDFLKSFDENFNDQANNYENPNYLTIGFTSAGPSLAITPEEQSLFYDQVSLRPKQSAYTIKRVDYTTLPTDRTTGKPKEIEFNLRLNVFNSLSDQINKAYTSSGWQRIASFMKTPEAEVVFGGAANKDFFIERLNRLRLSRMRRGSMGSGGAIEKAVDSLSVISRKLGTGIALGGIYQWIKQPPDQLITALGSGGRYDLLAKNIAPSTQKAARELLNKFSIGRRGDASSGYKYINQMEGHQNRLERYFSESKWDQAKEQAGKIADVWMIALKSSDFLAASAAWMTYYEGELNKQDIKIDDWSKEADLIESDPKRRQAAAFAEQMTDIYQGSSDPTQMATFAQSGKTGWENLVKAIFVPFNSFAIQQRMRLYSDARDAINGSAGGKGGLAGTIGGLILFHATKRYVIPAISGAGIAVLYGLMGVDMEEPDEEKQKEEANKNWRQFLADITGNLLVGGTPQIVESQFIDAMNRASYLVSLQLENDSILNDEGEIMSYDQYSKERSPFYRYKSFDNAMSLGMLEIGLGQAEQVALQTKMLATPEEMEMYTPEEQRLLYFSALSEWLYLMRLNDADFARLVSKARRDMIKAAEEREKELKRIQSGR